MTDRLTTEQRSLCMSRIKSKNTRPEIYVRRLLHAMGYRFRLHRTDLPGKPDIVLPKHRSVIFIHGCFWHGHRKCARASRPMSNIEFWSRKLDANVARDKMAINDLKKQSWRVLVLWECQLKSPALERRLRHFLES